MRGLLWCVCDRQRVASALSLDGTPAMRAATDACSPDREKRVNQFDIVVGDFLAMSRAIMSLTTDQLVV